MGKRWNGEMVKNFVENEGYELVSVPNWDYVKAKDRVIVNCGSHEEYDVRWNSFQQGRRCAKCSGNCRYSHDKICEEVSKIDSEYSVCDDSPKYKKNTTKLKLSCGEHEYFVSWREFMSGNRCPKCSGNHRYTHHEICEEVKKLDNNYFVCNDSPRYENNTTKLKLSCGEHEYFSTWGIFKSGNRCPECSNLKRSEKLAFSHEYVTEKIQELDSEYSVCKNSPVYENARTKLKLYHSVCGNEFYVTWTDFRRDSRPCGCHTSSKNEVFLREYLKSKNIEFSEQVTFDRLVSDKEYKLRYDFGIYENDKISILIEFDGQQHYSPQRFGNISQEQAEENLIKTQQHDKLKTDFAEKNNIPLFRFTYKDKFSEIEKMLNFILDITLTPTLAS